MIFSPFFSYIFINQDYYILKPVLHFIIIIIIIVATLYASFMHISSSHSSLHDNRSAVNFLATCLPTGFPPFFPFSASYDLTHASNFTLPFSPFLNVIVYSVVYTMMFYLFKIVQKFV